LNKFLTQSPFFLIFPLCPPVTLEFCFYAFLVYFLWLICILCIFRWLDQVFPAFAFKFQSQKKNYVLWLYSTQGDYEIKRAEWQAKNLIPKERYRKTFFVIWLFRASWIRWARFSPHFLFGRFCCKAFDGSAFTFRIGIHFWVFIFIFLSHFVVYFPLYLIYFQTALFISQQTSRLIGGPEKVGEKQGGWCALKCLWLVIFNSKVAISRIV